MNPFEIKQPRDVLRDANDRVLEIPPVPSREELEKLVVKTLEDSRQEGLRMISNVPEAVGEEEEGWRFSEIPSEVTRLTVENIMVGLTGESWFDIDKEEGYSAGEILEMLSKRAFVQMSRLTEANIRACLDNGGKVLAYFSDLLWRDYFFGLAGMPGEVLGMRTVEIEDIREDGGVTIHDFSSAQGRKKPLDRTSFAWLSQDGWMLEVYK